MAVSKALRYEVFRRDNHTCRYCGATAEDARLTIDHVTPTTLGGQDVPENLVTACADCNSGKSATPPDAPLVGDVSQDALRWARATQAASVLMQGMIDVRAEQHAQFIERWNNWTYAAREWSIESSRYIEVRKAIPIDDAWRTSLDRLLDTGLSMVEILDALRIAMEAYVSPDRTWRYFCGIGWKKARQLQEIAREIVESEGR